jgi:nicotinic acid mononucleotide adenylyltransferase
MAMAAFLRARRLAALHPEESKGEEKAIPDSPHPSPLPEGEGIVGRPLPEEQETVGALLAGVGCTASLVSDRPKLGAHRIHVAWQSGSTTATCSLELAKGRRSRLDEEQVAAGLVLNAVAAACGLSDRLALGTLPDESPTTTKTEAPLPWQDLLVGKTLAARHQNGSVDEVTSGSGLAIAGRRAIFPGAFNPLHDGHRRMAELAEANLGLPVEFEISIENVDKPPLDFTEMEQRLGQFAAGQTLWFTRAPTFDRKSELFPNTTFIVGADTIRRIADPRYYGGDPNAVAAATERIANRGGRFLVFARDCDGRCETLSRLILPGALRQLCTEVPADQFRLDVSSTALRQSRDE